jgi:hypothetical protein
MLLLLLAACGYPSYYPNPGIFTVDTGGGSASMPCGDTWAFEGVLLRVVSSSPVELDLYQVDSTCAETWIGPLAADPPLSVDAVPGAVFAARERAGGALYDWLQVPYGQDTHIWELR